MCKRVLIIGDQRHVRTLLHRVLEPLLDERVTIVELERAAEALAAAALPGPTVAIIDLALQGGIDLCRNLRAQATDDPLHIMVLADRIPELEAARCRVAGADELLPMPFDPDEILERVSTALGVEVEF
jgi:DNA-binding response OmpR family regulator